MKYFHTNENKCESPQPNPVLVVLCIAMRNCTFCVSVVRPGAAEGDDGVVVLKGEVRLVVVVVVVVKVVQARVGVAELRKKLYHVRRHPILPRGKS